MRRVLALPMVLAMALAMLFAGASAALATPTDREELIAGFEDDGLLQNAQLTVTIAKVDGEDGEEGEEGASVYATSALNPDRVDLVATETYVFSYSATGAGLEDEDAIFIRAFDAAGTKKDILGPDPAASSLDTTVGDAAEGSFDFVVPEDKDVFFVVSIERDDEVLFLEFQAVAIAEPSDATGSGNARDSVQFTVSTIPAPAAPAPAPAESPVTTVTGSATFVDASGNTVPATVSVSDGTMTVTAGGLTAAISGDRGATATAGPVAAPSGTISATITGAVTAGGVVEARLFSTPRLVAAARSDGSGTLTIDLPLGAPLDGGDPIPAGTHTMQLLIPTASGVVAMNVGVTVGGPVPASVPAGEGQVPTAPFAIAALLAVGATALVGRRTLVAPTA